MISWALLAFFYPRANAQDSDRSVGSVDGSVHADVEQQSQNPQPPQGISQHSTMFSNWSSQPTRQVPATAVWPAQATPSNLVGPTAGKKASTFSSFQPRWQIQDTVWPAYVPALMTPPTTADNSGKLRRRPDPFGILTPQHAHGSSTLWLNLTDPVSSASTLERGLPRLFERNAVGLAGTPFQTNFSLGRGRTKAKQHKPYAQVFADRSNTAVSPASPAR